MPEPAASILAASLLSATPPAGHAFPQAAAPAPTTLAFSHTIDAARIAELPSLALGQPDEADAENEPVAPANADATDARSTPDATRLTFGKRNAERLSIQFGVATNFDDFDSNARLTYHYFLADNFEINTSIGGWLHGQDGADAVSVNADLGFRYHFINTALDPSPDHWLPSGSTVYADLGIGFMYASNDVPDTGTRYNFTPRVGAGLTIPIDDRDTRLDLGVRWQHFSNASTSGTDDNPARDSVMLYAGVIFRF